MICDFGSARMLAPSCSLANLSSNMKGTTRFWAPQPNGAVAARHSRATDVWAFGMTIYVRNIYV